MFGISMRFQQHLSSVDYMLHGFPAFGLPANCFGKCCAASVVLFSWRNTCFMGFWFMHTEKGCSWKVHQDEIIAIFLLIILLPCCYATKTMLQLHSFGAVSQIRSKDLLRQYGSGRFRLAGDLVDLTQIISNSICTLTLWISMTRKLICYIHSVVQQRWWLRHHRWFQGALWCLSRGSPSRRDVHLPAAGSKGLQFPLAPPKGRQYDIEPSTVMAFFSQLCKHIERKIRLNLQQTRMAFASNMHPKYSGAAKRGRRIDCNG